MSRRIVLNPDDYPSDKDIFDLLMVQKHSVTDMRQFLKNRGIFSQSKDRVVLAKMCSELLLDYTDLQELTSRSDVKENRIRTVLNKVSLQDATIHDVYHQLSNQENLNIVDRVPLTRVGAFEPPAFDEVEKEIVLKRKFEVIDFGRTKLLQRNEHEFSIKIKETAPGNFELVYSTSATESADYFQQVRDVLSSVNEHEPIINEIDFSDLGDQKINNFLARILTLEVDGFKFDTAESVKLKAQDFVDESYNDGVADDSNEAVLSEEDASDEAQSTAQIKELNIHGKSVLEHEDVKRYLENGYFLFSLVVHFVRDYGDERRTYLVRFGFNKFKKFESELPKAWKKIGSEAKAKLMISKDSREAFLSELNSLAFDVFNSMRADS